MLQKALIINTISVGNNPKNLRINLRRIMQSPCLPRLEEHLILL